MCKRMEVFENKYSYEKHFNRLFYFAIPPTAFGDAAAALKKSCVQDEDKGWTRLIVEKPFGNDLESFEDTQRETEIAEKGPTESD